METLFAFLLAITSANLVAMQTVNQYRGIQYEIKQFEQFIKINNIYYLKGEDIRYEDMIDVVHSRLNP